MRRPSIVLAATLTVGAGLLAACGLEPAGAYVPEVGSGSLGAVEVDPDGPAVVVTSKDFTEQIVLGKVAVMAVASAGYPVADLTNVPGSVAVRELMLSGEATMTWEYTGTAWLTYLGRTETITDPLEMWEAVHEADRENGLTWLEPAELNNTYAMAVSREFHERTGIETLSEIAELDPADRTFCLEPEFNSRADGFNPMLEHYGLRRGADDGVPESNVAILDAGAVYTATAGSGTCNLGEVFSTDGRILELDLVVLEDDEGFFPSYNAAAVLGDEILEAYPELADLFGELSRQLTDEEIIELNRQVDVDGREPADVAYDWLVDGGFVSEP